jgi:hypothetical protein
MGRARVNEIVNLPQICKFGSFDELPFSEPGKKLHHVIKGRAKEDFPYVE